MTNSKATVFVFTVSIIQAISSLLYGYETTIVSNAQTFFNVEFGIEDDAFKQGVAVSEILIGCLIGALTGGTIADILGRNITLLVTDILMTGFTIGTALAPDFITFVILRFLLGYPIGIISVVVPLYISEIAHKADRGKIGVVTQLMITIGILIAYIVGATTVSLENNWRVMIGIGFFLNIVHFIAMLVIHIETPKWLLKKQRVDEARATLKRLRIGMEDSEIEEEIVELKAECFPNMGVNSERNDEGEVNNNESSDVLEKNGCCTNIECIPVFVGVFINAFNQFSGINAILYYCTDFFKAAGMGDDVANYIPIAVGAFNVIITIVSSLCIDKFGRRSLLLFSGAIMVFSHAVVSISFAGMESGWGSAFSYFCIIGCILFIFGFAIGLGPIPFVVVGEIFPSKTRALMMSLGLAGNWTTNLIISLVFPVFVDLLGQSIVFAGFCVFVFVGFFFVYFFLPETKGKGCEENYDNVRKFYKNQMRCVRFESEKGETKPLLK